MWIYRNVSLKVVMVLVLRIYNEEFFMEVSEVGLSIFFLYIFLKVYGILDIFFFLGCIISKMEGVGCFL